ncbi:hypothetical protein, partial [Paraburkholderia sp. NMBU_R16]|uniref:hypothetical protein n=1 Tax=Paraburkholderia sp. NMBU_R16 TaxID=2698676 RepID=UPI001C26B9B7
PHRFQFFSCEGRHRLPLLSELNGGIVRLPLRELYNAHGLPLTPGRRHRFHVAWVGGRKKRLGFETRMSMVRAAPNIRFDRNRSAFIGRMRIQRLLKAGFEMSQG